MIGKAERGPAAIEAIRKHERGLPDGRRRRGVSRVEGDHAVARASRFDDLGMEAIYEFDVKDMPVTVAVDANGTSVHNDRPRGVVEEDRRAEDPGQRRLSATGPPSGSSFAGGLAAGSFMSKVPPAIPAMRADWA